MTKKQHIIKEIKSWAFLIIIVFVIKSTIFAGYIVPTGSMENTIMTGDFLIGNQLAYNIHTPDRIGIPWTKFGIDIPHLRLKGMGKVSTGDIVIFRFPLDHSTFYVKRCIAQSGQKIKIIDKEIFIDDEKFTNSNKSIFTRKNSYTNQQKNQGIFPIGNGNEDNYSEITIPSKGDTLFFSNINYSILKNVVELDRNQISVENNQIKINNEFTNYYVVQNNLYFMMGDNRDNSYDSRFWGFVSEDLIIGKPLFVLASYNKKIPFYRILEKFRWKRTGKIIS